jgi:hypothetical protein
MRSGCGRWPISSPTRIAPDLSNRVRDGRWVTILAWCLARSHEVFHASGERSVATHLDHRRKRSVCQWARMKFNAVSAIRSEGMQRSEQGK